MQELVLVQPGRTVGDELEHDAGQAETRREFEERLSECGPLAYRVARGVLRHTADAEDVAQEALLRAYRRVGCLRPPPPPLPCGRWQASCCPLLRLRPRPTPPHARTALVPT